MVAAADSPTRRHWLTGLVLGYVALVALHWTLANSMRAPIILGDEAANLGIARFLAGRPPYPVLSYPLGDWSPYYRFGYPLLVAPAWKLTGDPLAVYRLALLLNGLLLAALFPLLASYARRTLGLKAGDAAFAAFVASLYPPFLLQGNLTWSESLLIPTVAGVCLAFQHLAARPGVAAACLFALSAVSAYAVHERALGLVPLALLAMALLWRTKRLTGFATLAGCGVAAAALAAVWRVDSAVFAALWQDSSRRMGVGDIALRLIDSNNLGNALLSLAGQLWYLTAASASLVVLGAWVLGRTGWRSGTRDGRHSARFTLAAAAVLLATSSVFLTRFPRADLAVYGRYADAFMAPLLLAGLAGFLGGERPRSRWAPAAALLPVPLAAVLLAAHQRGVFQSVYNEMTIAGLMPSVMLVGGLRILRIGAVATAVGVGLFVSGRRWPRAATLLMGVLFLGGSLWVHRGWLAPVQRTAFEARSIPVAVNALNAREVAYDLAGARQDEFFAYPFRFAAARFVIFDDRRSPPPRELLISNKTFGERHAGARLVFPEKIIDQALWVLPGALQDRLQREGWLFPADSGAALPPAAQCARLAWRAPPGEPIRLARGGRRRLELRLTHCGAQAPWLPFGARADPTGAVRIGLRWYQGASLIADRRAELPHVLAPGSMIDLDFDLEARTATAEPLPGGRYQVRLELVQELVQWFGEAPDGGLQIEVEVN